MIEVTVTNRRVQAERIVSLELVGPPELPAFDAGAHIDVEVAPGLLRQYSIANNPAERHRYVLGVLHECNSRGGSARIHSQFLPGVRVRISPPRNHFKLHEEASHSILIAGGIGVTPLLSMAHRLQQIRQPFTLHYCARNRDAAGFIGDIAASEFAGKAELHLDDGSKEQAFDPDAVLRSVGESTHVYVCGPQGFMDYVLGKAKEFGVPSSSTHVEYFSADVDTTGDSFTVMAARSGIEVTVGPKQTIAEALSDQGISVLLSCQEGVCGTCLTSVLEGVPDHRDLYLTEAEKAAGAQMTVCCSRAKTNRLVLDI